MAAPSSLAQMRSRLASFLGFSHSGQRDLYEQFGYDRRVTADELYAMSTRNDVASRIISAFPDATWRNPPLVRDEAGDGTEPGKAGYSDFVAAVDSLFDEAGLWQLLCRADRLGSIGRYGVLLLGFQDGEELSKPLTPGKKRLLYGSPYMETGAQIARWEQFSQSPRFGLPEVYTLTNTTEGGSPLSRPAMAVHHSRVIHIAEKLDQDDTFGLPRLLPIFNRLKDLEKVVGGAAETFWLTANRGLAIWADKDAQLQPEDVDRLGEQVIELQHNLRRHLVGSGMTAQVLGSESPDPKPNADVLLDLIAGATGIPKRILIGSERGELSSAQDENNWAARIAERQRNFAGPKLLRPMIQKLIDTGNLPQPKGKWWIEWPDNEGGSPMDQANVALARSNTLRNYVSTPGADLVVPPSEFRKTFLGLPPVTLFQDDLLDEPDPLPEDDLEPEALPAPTIQVNATPRTLYVCRPVLNAEAILAWARKQGFKKLVKPADLHVTIAFSRASVDWMKVPAAPQWGPYDETERLVVPRGGARLVEPLGDNALVLLFQSDALQWRHQAIRDAGASWDYPEYQPHVTISYDAAANSKVDLKKVKPWRGQIVLGPEIFEDLDPE